MLGITSIDIILYGMQFLEKIGKYECLKIAGWTKSCTKSDICVEKYEWRLDETDDFTLQNWVPQLNLICSSDAEIGLIGSAFWIGVIVGLPWYS